MKIFVASLVFLLSAIYNLYNYKYESKTFVNHCRVSETEQSNNPSSHHDVCVLQELSSEKEITEKKYESDHLQPFIRLNNTESFYLKNTLKNSATSFVSNIHLKSSVTLFLKNSVFLIWCRNFNPDHFHSLLIF